LKWNKGEYGWLSAGWLSTLITGGVFPAQALLFAYLVTALLNPDISAMRSRANFLSVWWLVIAIFEFIAYSVQGWGFGYASEKMVYRKNNRLLRTLGTKSSIRVLQSYPQTGNRIL
jgi:ATP-binding cassette subfamily B (MDR/TAP) protein 1